ncbi:global response regulator transcription factor PrrA [Roseibacterium beibuensis]|uniref:Global response regulator transcription factor PrrA n=2 Tax=[Roseibacterium] beibuensis TaxID=1193142 RepID=A0ABP9LBX9_9RHOB
MEPNPAPEATTGEFPLCDSSLTVRTISARQIDPARQQPIRERAKSGKGPMRMTQERSLREIGPDKSLLIVDDDEPFLRRLQRAMEKRGFEVEAAGSVVGGKAIATARPPAYAVVDLRLEDGNGLDVVETLREKRPDSRIVVLTGYGAIATAVAAVKIGATDYLSKPADANDITAALLAEEEEMPPPPENPMSADRVRWEHIQRVYELCDRNVSETARRLNMHRRTLQRILAKRSPR